MAISPRDAGQLDLSRRSGRAGRAVWRVGFCPAPDAAFSGVCDRATRRISLGRAGGGQGAITVRTSYGASSWPAVMAGTQVPQLTAVRGASDAVLDQLAYSRGRFAVEVQGQETLIVPAWAEISRVIEECRG